MKLYIKRKLLDIVMTYLAYIYINDRDLFDEYLGGSDEFEVSNGKES